jgi:hypothetical protein
VCRTRRSFLRRGDFFGLEAPYGQTFDAIPILFGEGARNPEGQSRFQAAFKRGFQTRDAEMDLPGLLGDLDDP